MILQIKKEIWILLLLKKKYYDKMTELIMTGIEQANEDLKKENETKLMQQVGDHYLCVLWISKSYRMNSFQKGVRLIPFVGGLLNWISPVENQNVSGRSFDLKSGFGLASI